MTIQSPVQKPAAPPSPETILQPGTTAPDFTLRSTSETSISLRDYRGQPVVLVFYPGDWSPVCGSQLALYNEILPEFERLNAQLLGISVDSVWSHEAYAKDRNLHFPLLSDFQEKGAVGRMYGVYDALAGEEHRSLFVIDAEGVIRWSYLAETWVNPGAAGILKALRALPADGRGESRS
jgi:peroxiredoxin